VRKGGRALPRIDGDDRSQYDRFTYLCCLGNFLRVARRGAAERRRLHGTANGLLNQ